MDYYVNFANLTSVFTMPTAVVDNHLKLAKAEHIKVLLYIMRNFNEEINVKNIAEKTAVSEYDVKEALLYWADALILLPKEAPPKPEEKKKAVAKCEKPSRSDVAKRGLEDPKIQYMLTQTQSKFGRNLKGNEASSLVWLYDDLGLDVSVILLIVQYAVTHNRANISFIESTAVNWYNEGINSIAQAEEELNKITLTETAWGIVCKVFGIERRKPGKKEAEYSYKWLEEWKITEQQLTDAYEECVNIKTKLNMAYIDGILANWHKSGGKSSNEIKNAKSSKKSDFAAYDIDLYEKMLNSKD
ncbi:MAG: DnaD domain protein [Clostridia bacterium]|nr:DnaD domain protein [Clostridia bacterium]